MPGLSEIGRGLADAVGIGDARSIRELYAQGVTLEAHLPGRSAVVVGRARVLDELASASPAIVRVLSERRSRGGSVVRLEARSEGIGVERRRHLVHVRRGRIVRHVVYPERAPAAVLPQLPEGEGAAGRVLARVRERVALEPGISGCLVELWRLDDGRVAFAKHLRAADSWMMRATADHGREADLWRSGVLDRVAGVVDHAVIAAVPEPGGWLLLGGDRSEALARPPRSPATRRRLLGAVGAIHEGFRGREVAGACGLADRLRLFSPATAAGERAGSDFAPKVIERGWELFGELAPPNVAAAVAGLAARPEPLERALGELPSTLLHGDLRPGNVGWSNDHAVLTDWGLALVGPAAFDATWWLFNAGWRSAASLDAMLEEVRVAPSTEEPALGLCLLAALVQTGAYFGFEADQNPDPAARRRASEGLAWWSAMARDALERLSP